MTDVLAERPEFDFSQGERGKHPYTPEFNAWWDSQPYKPTGANRFRQKAWAWHGWQAREAVAKEKQ